MCVSSLLEISLLQSLNSNTIIKTLLGEQHGCLLDGLLVCFHLYSYCVSISCSVEYVTTQKVARNNELKRSVKNRFEIAIALRR